MDITNETRMSLSLPGTVNCLLRYALLAREDPEGKCRAFVDYCPPEWMVEEGVKLGVEIRYFDFSYGLLPPVEIHDNQDKWPRVLRYLSRGWKPLMHDYARDGRVGAFNHPSTHLDLKSKR